MSNKPETLSKGRKCSCRKHVSNETFVDGYVFPVPRFRSNSIRASAKLPVHNLYHIATCRILQPGYFFVALLSYNST